MLLAAVWPGSTAEATDYAAPGPFQAGWRQITVSRPNGSTFTARLFYPATEKGENKPYNGSAAPYPAISFGHGYLTSRSFYQSTLEHLATWSYFVVATDSGMDLFPDHSKYADDLRYCLTYLENANADPTSWLYGQVDTAHFGLSGHSMGGGASILAAARDSRVVALANMAAAETSPSAKAAMADVRIPVRLIVGSADKIVSPSTTRAMYDNGNPPKQFSNIQGGWHCGFLDSYNLGCDSGPMPRADQLRLTRRLLTEFFNLYLKGDQGPWQAVWGPEWDDDPLVVTDRDAGVTWHPPLQSAETYLGAEVTYTVTLTNTSPYVTSYTMLAEDTPWPPTFVPVQTPALNPGAAISVQVTVQPPADDIPATETVLISARVDRDGGTRAYGWIETHALIFETHIEPTDQGLLLTWTASTANCSYRVYRATIPYFEPDTSTLIATLPPGSSAYLDQTPGVIGDPDVNYTYQVRAVCGTSAVDSGYLGEFDFRLTPGALP